MAFFSVVPHITQVFNEKGTYQGSPSSLSPSVHYFHFGKLPPQSADLSQNNPIVFADSVSSELPTSTRHLSIRPINQPIPWIVPMHTFTKSGPIPIFPPSQKPDSSPLKRWVNIQLGDYTDQTRRHWRRVVEWEETSNGPISKACKSFQRLPNGDVKLESGRRI